MNTPKSKIGYLEELKEFLTFLKNLWGILAGISIFFPLSNVLLGIIPLRGYGDDGVFDLITPALILTLATIFTLFVVLITFAGRNQFQDEKKAVRLEDGFPRSFRRNSLDVRH